MKRVYLLLLCLFSVLVMQAQDREYIFSSKNLKSWKKLNGKAEYKVMDGTTVGISKLGTLNTFLATQKQYDDFILESDFKTDEGLNSGVQLHSESKKDYQKGRVHGHQFKIDPPKRAWSGGIYDEARRDWLYSLIWNPQAKTAFKSKGWSKACAETFGNSIATQINGVPCANIWDDMTLSGFIALQVHATASVADKGKAVHWKNICICTTNVERYSTPVKAPETNVISDTFSPNEVKNGWTLLWDGKTSEGQQGAGIDAFPKKGWVMKNGILKIPKSGGAESANGGDIMTKQEYKNFILKVDFKITEGASSGIKYFANPGMNRGAGPAVECEFQILDDDKYPDAKLGVKGNRQLGSLYDLVPTPTDKPFNKKDFNTTMIIVRDNHVEHWLNGVKLIEYTRQNEMWNALVAYSKYKDQENFGNSEYGNILLQDHGDEVWFKNIKIKVLQLILYTQKKVSY